MPTKPSVKEVSDQAETYLNQSARSLAYDDVKKLLTRLAAFKLFDLASQVARHINRALPEDYDTAQRQWLRQRWALYTYKNEDLPARERLPGAWAILLGRTAAEVALTLDDPQTPAETLSIAGAIAKRMWEAWNRRQDLEQALTLYLTAYDRGRTVVGDWTYAAINAAYLLDLMALQVCNTPQTETLLPQASALRQRATELRNEVIQAEPELRAGSAQWWAYATLAEAALGLGDYSRAKELLAQGRAACPDVEDWERESTARQLAGLAKLHDQDPIAHHDGAQALDALCPSLVPSVEAARVLTLGRVGLALSGGGFRASLYHIGVLARLAELDLLRWIDTLSCVSGGSITGALYYLLLREQIADKETLSQDDYIDLVRNTARILTQAVQRDIRTPAFLKAIPCWRPNRSSLIGHAFEKQIFRPAAPSLSGGEAIPLSSLHVIPADEKGKTDKHFNPRLHNWRRKDRVPMLVLNATSLNTGHNWQFTASWMGEPPRSIDPAVDASERLRRFYFSDDSVPAAHQTTSLGTAVSASAGVPGVLAPTTLEGLYPDRTVRLVDGGVHDNQGLFGLDESGCSVLIVSDGSGQLVTQTTPSKAELSVVWRSNAMTMHAERRSLYQLYESQESSKSLKNLIYIHMKKGIEESDVTWIGGPKTRQTKATQAAETQGGTDDAPQCDLHPTVQRLLAETRTDLNIFPEVQARALIYAGYVLSKEPLHQSALTEVAKPPRAVDWDFLQDQDALRTAAPTMVKTLSRLQPMIKGWFFSRRMARKGAQTHS